MKTFIFFVYASVLILITGCGGDGGDNPPVPPSTITGKFVDSPVVGLNFICSSGATGSTDGNGQYTCNDGDSVTFSLGTYAIGSCTAAEMITPKTLYPDNNTAVINIAQLLQTVDIDGDPSNTITIPENFSTLDGATTLPTDASFDSDMETVLGKPLVSESRAAVHLNVTLSNLGLHFKVKAGDLAGKKLTFTNGVEISFYSNMIQKIVDGETHTGKWSIQNGVLIMKTTLEPTGTEPMTIIFDAQPAVDVKITFYAAQLGTAKVTAIENLTDDVVPPFMLSDDMLSGKIITTDSGREFSYYGEMVLKDGTEGFGNNTWSVEGGAVIHDEMCGGNKITSVVYDAQPAQNVKITYYTTLDGNVKETDTIASVEDLSQDYNLTYRVTVDELAGKKVVDDIYGTWYFYGNMTYKHAEDNVTRTWSVTNGLIVINGEINNYFFDATPATGGEIAYMNFCPSESGYISIDSFEDIE